MNSQINQQDENDKSLHNTGKKNRETSIGGVDIAPTITMNRCHGLCLEIMMMAVRAHVCVICYRHCARNWQRGYENRK